MPTKQLLAQLARLRACEESIRLSDGPPFGPDYRPEALIYFKEDPRWQQQYADLKRILAQREHVPKAPERRGRRLKTMKENRTKPRPRPKTKPR